MAKTVWEITQLILEDSEIDFVTKNYIAEKRDSMPVEVAEKKATKGSVINALCDENSDFIFVVELEEAIERVL